MNKSAATRSRELFSSGLYCAESVLLAISEAYDIKSELIPKIATGFCSGMGRTGGQCGALSGGIMGISLMTGRSSGDASVEATYARVKKIRGMFEEKFGETGCAALLDLDLDTEDGQRIFLEDNLFEKCLSYTEEATRMAIALIEEGDDG
jgi:C_GCAxxG_C_C family probable redox protein